MDKSESFTPNAIARQVEAFKSELHDIDPSIGQIDMRREEIQDRIANLQGLIARMDGWQDQVTEATGTDDAARALDELYLEIDDHLFDLEQELARCQP